MQKIKVLSFKKVLVEKFPNSNNDIPKSVSFIEKDTTNQA